MININKFALRHFDGISPVTQVLVSQGDFISMLNGKAMEPDSHKAGIFHIKIKDCQAFKGALVSVNKETVFKTVFDKRRDTEEGYIKSVVTAGGVPENVIEIDVVVYSHATLGVDATTDAEFEVVSINASAGEPMNPITMARNMLGKAGGTKVTYTAEEFANAVWYWSQHAMLGK